MNVNSIGQRANEWMTMRFGIIEANGTVHFQKRNCFVSLGNEHRQVSFTRTDVGCNHILGTETLQW